MEVDISNYDMDQIIMGMSTELEHGSKNEKTDVTGDDPTSTFKIVLAHLDEIKDYYTRLKKMEDITPSCFPLFSNASTVFSKVGRVTNLIASISFFASAMASIKAG